MEYNGIKENTNDVKKKHNGVKVFFNLRRRRGRKLLNKNLFRAMHTARGDSQKFVAENVLGISEQTLSAKVNGDTDFKHSEIKLLIDRYNLTPEDVEKIFFGDITV